jgi:hypothetical protein
VAGRSPGQVAGLGRGLIGLSKLPVCLGPIAQLVERMAGSHEVRGSNPLGSTFNAIFEHDPSRTSRRSGWRATRRMRALKQAISGDVCASLLRA